MARLEQEHAARVRAEKDLANARALLLGQNFVLVTHCNAMNAHGELIADRAKMVDRVSRACARAGITLIDPGSLLAAYSQERGMSDDGRDTAHYTPAFARLVGKEISDKLLGVQETAVLPEGEAALDWKQSVERAKEYGQTQAWDLALLYAIRSIDPAYAGLASLQRTLSDAHKREFQDQRQQSSDQSEVIASARRVIESNPLDREANVELVMQSLRTGNLGEGRRLLKRFMENSPA